MEVKDLKWVYDTVLSGPGMDETVKLNFSASRKLILLLTEVILIGTTIKGNALLESIDKELIKELDALRTDFLEKAKLSKLNNQLKALV
ncbi:MAG: hypothetical protein BGO31_10880 [Bacteroidetes bacterium 43-16]|uniref:hypothetical protein n=1 Tax=uncultured Dysgonomonas sp. TaxID=206096 RepID=UPI000926A379|nr:hypothetical protein [uncultured Dysgonomonas sp.]OJV50963.1 MAG: hypothetical protein BGO31_10880 [Bacteroidetes bacterium 43-16]